MCPLKGIIDAFLVNHQEENISKHVLVNNHMELYLKYRLFLMIEIDLNGDTALLCLHSCHFQS